MIYTRTISEMHIILFITLVCFPKICETYSTQADIGLQSPFTKHVNLKNFVIHRNQKNIGYRAFKITKTELHTNSKDAVNIATAKSISLCKETDGSIHQTPALNSFVDFANEIIPINFTEHIAVGLEEFISENEKFTFVEKNEGIIPCATKESSKTQHIEYETKEKYVARVLVLIAAALYGTNFTIVKIMNESIPVGIGTVLRFGLASVCTLPWLLSPLQEETQSSESNYILQESGIDDNLSSNILQFNFPFSFVVSMTGMEIGLWNSIGYWAQAVGLETTAASKSAFICSLAVVIVPILNFLSGKKILPKEVMGALVAVFGVAMLELDGIDLSTKPLLNIGELASLVQPIAFGIAFWRMESALKKFPAEAMKLTAGQLFGVFLASSFFCFISFIGTNNLPTLSLVMRWVSEPEHFASLIWTGLITTALTIYMETLALKSLSAAETTVMFATEPLFGSIFAAYVAGEQFGLGGFFGGALIICGCIFGAI